LTRASGSEQSSESAAIQHLPSSTSAEQERNPDEPDADGGWFWNARIWRVQFRTIRSIENMAKGITPDIMIEVIDYAVVVSVRMKIAV
jgi:hypothetical protein